MGNLLIFKQEIFGDHFKTNNIVKYGKFPDTEREFFFSIFLFLVEKKNADDVNKSNYLKRNEPIKIDIIPNPQPGEYDHGTLSC